MWLYFIIREENNSSYSEDSKPFLTRVAESQIQSYGSSLIFWTFRNQIAWCCFVYMDSI